MKSNHLTNILLLAVLAAILPNQLPVIAPIAAQPAAAAPAVPSGYNPQGGMVNGYISIPAAAFHPALSSNLYTNGGSGLYPGSSGINAYWSEVSLPDGATIDQLDCLMRDLHSTENGFCRLLYVVISGTGLASNATMADVWTNHSTNDWALYSTTNIFFDKVDNSQKAYMIALQLHYTDASHYLAFAGARIHYYYSAVYMPVVSK